MKRLPLVLFLLLLTAPLFSGDTVFVKRVIDGDTFETESGVKIRLIGVDTPETVHPSKPVEQFGKEASQFTSSQLEGKRVILDYDRERIDKYGRTLAYVYLDTVFFNAKLIREGYAHAYTLFPFKHLEEFRQYERTARETGKGLWSDQSQAMAEPVAVATSVEDQNSVAIFRTKTGKKFHRDGCRSLAKSKIPVSLSEAKAMGLEPCSICQPPQLASASESSGPQDTSIEDKKAGPVIEDEIDPIIYVTAKGSTYHWAGCRVLLKENARMFLSEAQKIYQPCSFCAHMARSFTASKQSSITQENPTAVPLADTLSYVYVTPSGGKYHFAGCRYAKGKNLTKYTVKQAESAGYSACSVCGGGSSPAVKTPVRSSSANREILTGPRGGKYYISPSGKKVYIKKK